LDKVYFLIFVGVLALVLVSWLATMERRRSLNAKKQKSTTYHAAQVHHGQPPTVRHGLPSRTTALPPRRIGTYEQRHQRAGEEMRHGSAITAEQIFSDEEISDHEKTHGLEMSAIRFVPEDTAESLDSWAAQRRR
jgi:hypothetical protein